MSNTRIGNRWVQFARASVGWLQHTNQGDSQLVLERHIHRRTRLDPPSTPQVLLEEGNFYQTFSQDYVQEKS